jgi:hypothetical protein
VTRALIYDRRAGGLSRVWQGGAALYRGLRRFDAVHAAEDWDGALAWVAALPGGEPLRELQYWGHGKWGCAYVGDDVLDADDFARGGRRRRAFEALRARLATDALLWFRTCETFGARRGIDFAERLTDFSGARVAGHTYVIHYHQSGLHALAPGMRADWSAEEGLLEGSADEPRRARRSAPWAPRTVSCLEGRIPRRWLPA